MPRIPGSFPARYYEYTPPSERLGLIYVIRDGVGAVKIGFTSDHPEKRLAALQTASPHKLELVGFFAARKCDETTIHRYFRRHRIRGEWFKEDELTIPRIIDKLYRRILVLEDRVDMLEREPA